MLKEIIPEYSLKGLMLKLKLKYFGHLMQELIHWIRPWCWKRLRVGEWDDRGWHGWMASLTQWAWVWANSGRERRTGKPGVLQSMGSPRVRHNDWTATTAKTIKIWEGNIGVSLHELGNNFLHMTLKAQATKGKKVDKLLTALELKCSEHQCTVSKRWKPINRVYLQITYLVRIYEEALQCNNK